MKKLLLCANFFSLMPRSQFVFVDKIKAYKDLSKSQQYRSTFFGVFSSRIDFFFVYPKVILKFSKLPPIHPPSHTMTTSCASHGLPPFACYNLNLNIGTSKKYTEACLHYRHISHRAIFFYFQNLFFFWTVKFFLTQIKHNNKKKNSRERRCMSSLATKTLHELGVGFLLLGSSKLSHELSCLSKVDRGLGGLIGGLSLHRARDPC